MVIFATNNIHSGILRFLICTQLLMNTVTLVTPISRSTKGQEVEEMPHWKTSIYAAKAYCANNGWSFIGGSKPEDENKLQELMITNTSPYVWTDVRMQAFGRLTWVTGDAVDERTFDPHDAKCGAIDTSDREIYEHSCQLKQHFLCELENCHICKPEYGRCVTQNRSCYLLSSLLLNWYAASNRCRIQGGRLAVIRSEENIVEISSIIMRQEYDRVFWIGARTIDWVVQGKQKFVMEYRWIPGQPNCNNNCVVLVVSGRKFGWKTHPCDAQAHFACRFDAPTSEAYLPDNQSGIFPNTPVFDKSIEKRNISIKSDEPETKGLNEKLITIVFLPVVAVLLICVLMLCFCLCLLWRRAIDKKTLVHVDRLSKMEAKGSSANYEQGPQGVCLPEVEENLEKVPDKSLQPLMSDKEAST